MNAKTRFILRSIWLLHPCIVKYKKIVRLTYVRNIKCHLHNLILRSDQIWYSDLHNLILRNLILSDESKASPIQAVQKAFLCSWLKWTKCFFLIQVLCIVKHYSVRMKPLDTLEKRKKKSEWWCVLRLCPLNTRLSVLLITDVCSAFTSTRFSQWCLGMWPST